MKCYNHHEVDAVGICKSCSKGLCPDCLTEVENGIACTTTCVEDVQLLNSLVQRSKGSYQKTSGAMKNNSVIYTAFGIALIIFGVMDDRLTTFLVTLGILFILGAVLSMYSANRFKSEK